MEGEDGVARAAKSASQRLSPFVLAYNTSRVREAEAPKGWVDLLNPKWKGRIVHAHPGYAGGTLAGMHMLQPLLPADYYQRLAKSDLLIVQSATDVATKVVAGERDVGAGTPHYNVFPETERGNPIRSVIPVEGLPLLVAPQALAKHAPRPNAAKLFLEFSLSREAQQYLVTEGGLHSARGDVQLPAGQVDLTKLKLLFSEPEAMEKARESIQKMFKDAFGV